MPTQPVEHTVSVHDVEIAVWEWPGTEPAIVLCHATGFHGRCWDQIVSRLHGRRAVALDFRGHGRSTKPLPPYHWRPFGEDLAVVLGSLDVKDAIGVGHSMGGHSVVLAAARNPQAFSALLLLDPTILPKSSYTGTHELLDFVLRRKNTFSSSQQMFDRFVAKPPFRNWDPAVLRDYCDYALDGTALACSPSTEASIYAHSSEQQSDIYPEVALVHVPVRVVRSRSVYTYGNFDASPTAPDLAGCFGQGIDECWPDVSHFIPMEAPARVAELILRLS